LHLSQYVYINFQVIISITIFIENSLGPLATEPSCIIFDNIVKSHLANKVTKQNSNFLSSRQSNCEGSVKNVVKESVSVAG